MLAMTFLAAIVCGILLCQWLYLNAAWLLAGLLHGTNQAANALIHPSVTSPINFAMLAMLAIAAVLFRRAIGSILAYGAVATVPLVTFLGIMSIMMPPRIANSHLAVGTIEFHDWSGLIQKRRSDQAHAFDVQMAETDHGPAAIRYCRQLIDQDSIATMANDCATLGCDRIEKGTIETDPRTMTLNPAMTGRVRDHSHLASVCESLRYN